MEILESITSKTQSKRVCAHCGLPAFEHIHENDNYFCCHGCKTAFTFLNDSPNCVLPSSETAYKPEDISYLDLPEVRQKWVIAEKDNIIQVRLQIPSIHCASCVQVLERLYLKKHGIIASRVNFLTKEVEVTFQPEVLSFSQLATFLSQLGYSPSLADPGNSKDSKKAISESTLITLRMAVAGFCAGNIMLLSFPEYLGLDDHSYRHFFGWLNLILAMPAIFFSGWGYLKSVYNALVHKVLNIDVPIGVGMLATLIMSLIEVITQTGSGYFDSLTGLIFFLLIGRWVQNRTFQYLSFERDFRSYFPLSITRLDGEKEEQMVSTDIKPGDRLKIHFGEIVPCDGVLEEGVAMMDYSFVSGESTPVRLQVGERILAGGKQTGGVLIMKAEQEMSRSQLTTLWNNPIFQKEGKPQLKSFTDTVARYFTPIILVFAFLVALFWAWVDPSKSLHAFLSVLIIACPCTLSLSYPIALGNTMRIWGKVGFFLKNSEVVERLSKVKTIVFDKTGTLTQRLGVKVSFHGEPLNENTKSAVMAILSASKHPLSQSIVAHLGLGERHPVFHFHEEKGQGIQGTVLDMEVKAGSANWTESQEVSTKGSVVYLSVNGIQAGYFEIEAAPHPFVAGLLEHLSKKFELNLLSGDHAEGQQFWQTLFSKLGGKSLFSQGPEAKLEYIQNLQKNNHPVAMIGDGLNDSGALRQADAGIALADNAHQFTPGSDAILLSEHLDMLPQFFDHAKSTLSVVRFSFLLSLIYNIIGLTFAVRGDLQPIVAAILMPINSLTMVLVAWVGTNRKFTISEKVGLK